jgi:transcriptional regulator with XRE-family HTH domain
MILQKALQERKAELGLSYEAIGKKANLDKNTVCRIFNTPHKSNFGSILEVCRALDIKESFTLIYELKETRPDNLVHRFRCPICGYESQDIKCVICGVESDLI